MDRPTDADRRREEEAQRQREDEARREQEQQRRDEADRRRQQQQSGDHQETVSDALRSVSDDASLADVPVTQEVRDARDNLRSAAERARALVTTTYPAMRYHESEPPRIVQGQAEDEALGWAHEPVKPTIHGLGDHGDQQAAKIDALRTLRREQLIEQARQSTGSAEETTRAIANQERVRRGLPPLDADERARHEREERERAIREGRAV